MVVDLLPSDTEYDDLAACPVPKSAKPSVWSKFKVRQTDDSPAALEIHKSAVLCAHVIVPMKAVNLARDQGCEALCDQNSMKDFRYRPTGSKILHRAQFCG